MGLITQENNANNGREGRYEDEDILPGGVGWGLGVLNSTGQQA